MKPKVLINYAILCFIWGTTWIILKKSLIGGTPPFFGSGFRFFFGGIILWGVILYKRDFPSFKALPLQLYVQFGLLNLTICYGLNLLGNPIYLLKFISSYLGRISALRCCFFIFHAP